MFSTGAIQQMWNQAWPVISVLLFCSVISFAIILERWVSLTRAGFSREGMLSKLQKMLGDNRVEQAVDYCEGLRKPVGKVMAALLEFAQQNRGSDRERLERHVDRLIRAESGDFSRYLTVLGT